MKDDLQAIAACAPLVRRHLDRLRDRLEAAVGITAGNNNQPRVFVRDSRIELVLHHRALADMALPANVAEAASIRQQAIDALFQLLTDPVVLAPGIMTRDLQVMTEPQWLNVVPDILDEVEAHRETKKALAEAEQRIEELEAVLERMTEGQPVSTT